jgi:hypothetical protein
MLIKYIIADDGDEISHPNIYTINSSSSSITLDIIKKVLNLYNFLKYIYIMIIIIIIRHFHYLENIIFDF